MKRQKFVRYFLAGICGGCLLSSGVLANASVVSKASDLTWKIYGRVKVDFNYDTVKYNFNDFIGAVSNATDWGKDSTNFNPKDTRLGFIITSDQKDIKTTGRIEIDFYGPGEKENLVPRMRLGYIDLFFKSTKTDLRVGQDWVPIAQLNPSTVDFGVLSECGNLWWRLPQITLRQNLNPKIQVLFSIMRRHRRPKNYDKMPWLLGRVQYKTNLSKDINAMLAIGGGYKRARINNKYVTKDLVVGEFKFGINTLGQKFLLKGEIWTGRGIGGDFLRYGLDVNANDDTIYSTGGWADITWYATKKLSFTGGAGIDNPKDKNILAGTTANNLGATQFTQNTAYYVNTWYKITQRVKVGAEFMHVITKRGSLKQEGNRYTLSFFYNF